MTLALRCKCGDDRFTVERLPCNGAGKLAVTCKGCGNTGLVLFHTHGFSVDAVTTGGLVLSMPVAEDAPVRHYKAEPIPTLTAMETLERYRHIWMVMVEAGYGEP